MKTLALGILFFYRHILSYLLKSLFGAQDTCRYSPTCSVYAEQMIKKDGVIKGTYATVVRLLSCQPFGGISYV